MRFARILSCAVGTVALCALGEPAFADEATPIHLVEVYDVTPGVSATHEVTLDDPAVARRAVPVDGHGCARILHRVG